MAGDPPSVKIHGQAKRWFGARARARVTPGEGGGRPWVKFILRSHVLFPGLSKPLDKARAKLSEYPSTIHERSTVQYTIQDRKREGCCGNENILLTIGRPLASPSAVPFPDSSLSLSG